MKSIINFKKGIAALTLAASLASTGAMLAPAVANADAATDLIVKRQMLISLYQQLITQLNTMIVGMVADNNAAATPATPNILFDNSATLMTNGINFKVGTSTRGGALVMISWSDYSSSEPASVPSLGGTSATFLNHFTCGGPCFIHVYYVPNVALGTYVVNNVTLGTLVQSYLNVDPAAPIASYAGSLSGTANAESVNVATTGSWLWGVWNLYGAGISLSSGPLVFRGGSATGLGTADSNGSIQAGTSSQMWSPSGGVGITVIKPAQ